MKKESRILVFAVVCMMLLTPLFAGGQSEESSLEYPQKPITIIIPYAAGGSADMEARLLCEAVSANIEQPINLVFKPGGSNIPGTMEVLNAPADGYTLFWYATPVFAINPARQDTPYTYKDLTPIMTAIDNPIMLFVRKDSPIKNLDDFLNSVKMDDITVGINAIGSVPFMAAAQVAQIGDVKLKYITQKTNPAATVALMGGHVDVAFGTGPQLKTYGDDIRGIALFAPIRNSSFPNVPTAIEQGYNVIAPVSSGIAVKAGTADDIVDYLESEFLSVINSPEYQESAKSKGMFPADKSIRDRLTTQKNWEIAVELYGKLVEELGLKK